MPNLGVLQCKGNSFRDAIPNYRKTLVARLPNLKYLDERPVTEDERRRAEAFAEGQLPAEREVIKLLKKEKEVFRNANLEEFDGFLKESAEEKQAEE